MSTALYRRYRPDTFDQVIGQEHVTEPLKAALRANRVTHAYLFSGPRGCGKTTSARILARCLNCAQGPTDTPCGECESCRELATGGPGSLDVVEIDAASHGGVDDARDLRERATFAPVRDRYKVFIIDEAHMVTNQGFNALLKLVEEPPEHVKFVFATTEPERVIGTIRSRTHHYPFRLVPPDVLAPYLTQLCEEEHITVGDGVLSLVMRAGGGSVRDTLSVLDQLMAGAIDGQISYHTAVALLGYTDSALLDESVDALAGGDGGAAFRVVERMIESGHDPRRFVEDLLQRLRDLLIIAVAGDGARDVLSDTPADQLDRMQKQAQNWGPRALSRAADLTDEALRSMTGATSPRLQLELLVGRILVPSTPQVAAPVHGSVGMVGGGAPRENEERTPAPSHFGAREAREALARKQRERAGERAASPSHEAIAPAPSAPSAQPPAPVAPIPAASTSAPGPVPTWGDAPTSSEATQSAEASHVPAPAQQESAVSGRDADMLRGRWGDVVERLSSISRVTWSIVGGNAQLGAVDGSHVVLLFPVEAMMNTFVRGNRAGDVEKAILEATGLHMSVSAQVGQASGGSPVTAPSAPASHPTPPNSRPAPPEPDGWVSTPPPFDRAATPAASPASVEEEREYEAAPTAPAVDTPASSSSAASETRPTASSAPTTPVPETPVFDDTVTTPTYTPTTPTGWDTPVVIPGGVTFDEENESATPTSPEKTPTPARPSAAEDDSASIDDDNIDTSATIGLSAVLEILGGHIIEEKMTDEGY